MQLDFLAYQMIKYRYHEWRIYKMRHNKKIKTEGFGEQRGKYGREDTLRRMRTHI